MRARSHVPTGLSSIAFPTRYNPCPKEEHAVMDQSWTWWIGFNVAVLVMLALDLGIVHRKSHVVRIKEALLWSILWTLVALLFNAGIWAGWIGNYPAADRGRVALEFFTGYIIERSLSFDNLFVFAVIFSYFAVPPKFHHRVLFYGILGALLCRAAFIFGGTWLINQFHWMIYVFGVFLILTGIKLGVSKDQEIQPERNPILRLLRRLLPVTDYYIEGRFLAWIDGRLWATPLLLVVVFLELTDVLFALDSIPAIIAITRDTFIIYTSNVMAILGLRALYFLLAAAMGMFHYLSYGLAVLLVFIGFKMLADATFDYQMPIGISLGIVGLILAVAIGGSLLRPPAAAPRDGA
jgi:tellurite resistance protein TerC